MVHLNTIILQSKVLETRSSGPWRHQGNHGSQGVKCLEVNKEKLFLQLEVAQMTNIKANKKRQCGGWRDGHHVSFHTPFPLLTFLLHSCIICIYATCIKSKAYLQSVSSVTLILPPTLGLVIIDGARSCVSPDSVYCPSGLGESFCSVHQFFIHLIDAYL